MPPRARSLLLVLLASGLAGCAGDPVGPLSSVPGMEPAASGPAVVVRVDAAQGPQGGAPEPFDARLFGTNLFGEEGWWPVRDPDWFALLEAIRPGALRWPAGHLSQESCFEAAPRVPWPGCQGRLLPRAQLEAFAALARDLGAEPVVGLNTKTAPPEMAAAMVAHARDAGLGVRWWQVGNEPDLGYDDANLSRYVWWEWPRFAAAVRAADPSARLVGPELMTGAHVTGAAGRADWMRRFLQAGPAPDALSWHLYPLDSENPDPASPARPRVGGLFQEEAPDWPPAGLGFPAQALAKLGADRDALAPGAELWVTELGPDSGAPGARGLTDGQAAAVWFAEVLARLGGAGADAAFQFAFDHWSRVDELSLVRRTPEGLEPLPPWYVYRLYAEHGGHAFARAASGDPAIGAYAMLREDGGLTVMLTNRGAEARTVRVEAPPSAGAPAGLLTLEASGPTSLEAKLNGQRLGPGALHAPPRMGRLGEFWDLPPYSVTFAVLPG